MADRDSAREFSDFVTSRYAGLVRTAYLLVGDRGHAEDLVQSALVRCYAGWDKLAGPQVAEAYTRTTMIRLAQRWGRRRWRGEVPSADVPDSPDSPFLVEQSLDLRRALVGLSWAQRSVLVLRYFDDLTEQQTAQVLGCSVGTVKSRASRGLAQLRATGLLTDLEGTSHG
jgi:RNA polymerase sigma-70 factor (sigma-E family)